jgi:hypothetical protein
MAYIVRENQFANFELVNAETDEVIAHGSNPGDLCEFAVRLLPCSEVSCLAETLPGGVRRTIQPLSAVARQALRRRDLSLVSFHGEPFGDIRL